MYIVVSLITGTTLYKAVMAATSAVTMGEEMTFSEVMKNVVDIGVTPVLLLIFICYFLSKSKSDDARVAKSNEALLEWERKMNEEAAKREKLIRQEAEKQLQLLTEDRARREQQLIEDCNRREDLSRKESEKRESILMGNMERMIQNMDRITETMRNIDLSMAKVNERLEKIEERMCKDDSGFGKGECR